MSAGGQLKIPRTTGFDPVPEKRCPRCKTVKPADAFHRNRSRLDGLQTACTECIYPNRPPRVYTSRFDKHALLAQGLKKCTHCAEIKPLADFSVGRSEIGGKQSICKACNKLRDTLPQRRHMLRRHYGLTLEDYAKRLAAQDGCCDVCGDPPGKRPLNVDHDHVTGEVRGLLCGHCNRAIGQAKEDPDRLISLAVYLFKYERSKTDGS